MYDTGQPSFPPQLFRLQFNKFLDRIVFCIPKNNDPQGGRTMKPREAIRILMLSPIYFRLRPPQRWQLVREYCQQFNACTP
jgi:hypothetical protein